MMSKTIVLKFGGSVLTDEAALHRSVAEIYRYVRMGMKVVAVVSAFKGQTDALIRQADGYGAGGDSRAVPYLLATGEFKAAALLGLACERSGINARVRTPSELTLTAEGARSNAQPTSIDVERLKKDLIINDVVIVPGFVAETPEGETVLLGRGGTDLSAVFIAAQLGASVRLLKDVDGVYDADPAIAGEDAHPFAALAFEGAEEVAHPLVQDKAIRLARFAHLPIEVAGLGRSYATIIGQETAPRIGSPCPGPLKVAILGAGVVGASVIDRLREWPELFDVVKVLVRDVQKRKDHPLADRFTSDAAHFAKVEADVFVDAGAGVHPSLDLIEHFLKRGIHVVSANKQAVAQGQVQRRGNLSKLASEAKVHLAYSASVGGGSPFLETISRVRTESGNDQIISAVEGVINGTSNYVLDRVLQGLSLDAALAEARRLGFAEPDSLADLDGTDVLAKLKLVADLAFPDLTLSKVAIEPITEDRLIIKPGTLQRYVALVERSHEGLKASIRLELLSLDHFLAGARGERNRLQITLDEGQLVQVDGKGAGPWPTSEALLADLFDVRRLLEDKA